MKNNSVLFAAVLALLTTVASAQHIKVDAKVPFNFTVNRVTLPAGEYVVQSMNEQGDVLAIRGLDSNTSNLVMSNACEKNAKASRTTLIFHRYGDQYFLSQIWLEGANAGHELLVTPQEKEVAKDYSKRDVVLTAEQR